MRCNEVWCTSGLRKFFNYNIDGNLLAFVSSHTDLGVLIDPELRFHDHDQSVVRKGGGLPGESLHFTVCCTPNFMVSLFVSHIRPIMYFVSSVWNSPVHDESS